MKHILFIVTSTNKIGIKKREAGYEFSEIADPYFEFIKKGYTIDFASILGRTPPYVGYDASKKRSNRFKNGSGFKRLNFSHKLEDVNIEAYDGIFFPGGLGLMKDMVNSPLVKEIVKKMYENKRVIGAVCHGPTALLGVRLSDRSLLLEGKKVSSFTALEEELDGHTLEEVIPFMLEEELIKEGASFFHTEPFKPYVVCDRNLVTGQNPESASLVALKMIDVLEGIA